MNYATQHHTGYNPNTRQKTTDTIAPTIGRVCRISTTPKRPQRNSKRQKAICTDRPTINGFLKTTFLPKIQVNKEQTKISKKQVKQTEEDFYQSLTQLAEHYNINPIKTRQYDYPYNMALGYWDAKQKIKQQPKGKYMDELQICAKEHEKTILSVQEKCDTGQFLYYVPVLPLFELLKNKSKNQTAQLLLSVFCYLYRVVGVPFYREDDSYLFWMYNYIQDWVTEDDGFGDENMLSELRKASCIGDVVLKKLQSKENLIYWHKRIQTFRVKDDFDKRCLKIASQFFDLYQRYKNQHIYLNINRYDDNYCYDDEYLTIDKYLSFISNTKGGLFDQLFETVNNELSNYGDMEEPNICKSFNGKDVSQQNLDFENRIFSLLNELCHLLS